MAEDNGRLTVHLVNARVDSIEKSVAHIYGKLDDISQKIDAKAQPNWSILILGLGVIISLIIGVTTLVFNPLNDRIDEVRDDAGYRSSNNTQVIEKLRNEMLYDLGKVDERLNTSMVPRSEIQTLFNSLSDRVTTLSNRIDETKSQLGQLYGPGDKLKDIQTQLDSLRSAILESKRPQISTIP